MPRSLLGQANDHLDILPGSVEEICSLEPSPKPLRKTLPIGHSSRVPHLQEVEAAETETVAMMEAAEEEVALAVAVEAEVESPLQRPTGVEEAEMEAEEME